MKNTLKTITLSLSILLITCLVNVSEVRAEGVKKVNSGSSVGKEQNKQVTTEYKSELVDKIIKAYKLDPKNNPEHQCILTDAISAFFELAESSEEEKKRFSEVIKAQKAMGISEIKESCNKNGDCSINDDVVMKELGTEYDQMTLFFDKYGNPIGYLQQISGGGDSMEEETKINYDTEYFFSLNKNHKKGLDFIHLELVDKKNLNAVLAVKGCYVTYSNLK